jgi:hypothetical protein
MQDQGAGVVEIGRSQHRNAVEEGQSPVLSTACADLSIGSVSAQIADDGVAGALVARKMWLDNRKTGLDNQKIAHVGCKIALVNQKIAAVGCFSAISGEKIRLAGCFSAPVGELFGFSPRRAGFSPRKTAFVPRKTGFAVRKLRAGARGTDMRPDGFQLVIDPLVGFRRRRHVPTLRQLIATPQVRRGRPAPRIAGSHTKVPPPGFRSTVFK